jgi:hypothetical protein
VASPSKVEYASAAGNDYPAHERQYENFMLIAFVGACHVINVILALAIGTVIGGAANVGVMVGILIVATLVAVHGLASGVRIPSGVMVLISALLLAFCAYAH